MNAPLAHGRMELLREIRNQARFRATDTIQANRLMNDTGLGGFVDEDTLAPDVDECVRRT